MCEMCVDLWLFQLTDLNIFIKKRVTAESNDFKSLLFTGQLHSRPSSQCSMLVRTYTVVRAIPQVNGEWRFSTTWWSVTPEPIELKFDMIDYICHPTQHAKIGSRREGVMWGYGWSCHLACFFPFLSFPLVPWRHAQLTLRIMTCRSVHPITCFSVD